MGCIRRVVNCFFSLLFLALLVIGGAYALTYYYVNNELPNELRRYFLLPPSAEVEIVQGDFMDNLTGRVKQVRISSPEALISDVVVENLDLTAKELEFNILNLILKRSPVVKTVGFAEVSFEITTDSIAKAWLKRGSRFGLKSLKLKFTTKGGVLPLPLADVEARVEVLKAKFDVHLQGYFELTRDKRIEFKLLSLDVEGLKLGKELLERIFVGLSPEIRVEDLQKDLRITEFKIEGQRIRVRASTLEEQA